MAKTRSHSEMANVEEEPIEMTPLKAVPPPEETADGAEKQGEDSATGETLEQPSQKSAPKRRLFKKVATTVKRAKFDKPTTTKVVEVQKGKEPVEEEIDDDEGSDEDATNADGEREVVRPLTLDLNCLKLNGAGNFVTHVIKQGWKDLLENKLNVHYNEARVREFYKNMSARGKALMTKVDGTLICLNEVRLGEIMGISGMGFDLYVNRKWPEHEEIDPLEITKRFTGQKNKKKPVNKIDQKQLSPEQKLAFHLIWRTLIPRSQRRSTANMRDLVYMELFETEKPINLPALIFNHMKKVGTESPKHSLPYASLITLILKDADVPIDLSGSLPTDRTNIPFLRSIHLEFKNGRLVPFEKVEEKEVKVGKAVQIDWSNADKLDRIIDLLSSIDRKMDKLEEMGHRIGSLVADTDTTAVQAAQQLPEILRAIKQEMERMSSSSKARHEQVMRKFSEFESGPAGKEDDEEEDDGEEGDKNE